MSAGTASEACVGPAGNALAGSRLRVERTTAGGLVLLALLALLLFYRLGAAPVTNAPEMRCADIIEGMVSSGDWLVPRRLGGPWLNKPPLYYWLGAVTVQLSGHLDRFALRLPSALAALLLVALAWRWMARVLGPGVGLTTAVLLAMMVELHSRGREGTAEMTLALLCNLAYVVFDRIHNQGRVGWTPLFAVVLASACLAKATAALLVIGLPLAVLLLHERRLGAAVGGCWGWLLAAVVVGFAWYGVLLAFVPEARALFFNAAAVPLGLETDGGPAVHSAAHYKPWFMQCVYFVEGSFPVSLLLPVVIWRGVTSRLWAAQPTLRLLAVVVLSLLVAFSILPQKRPHYMLPSFPALAALTADSLLALRPAAGRLSRAALATLGGVGVIVGLALAGVLGFWFGQVLDGGLAGWAAGLPVGLASVGALWLARRGQRAAAGVLVACVWGAGLFTYSSISEWRAAFEAGRAGTRADYDASHWEALRARYPQWLGAFEPDEDVGRDPPQSEWQLSAQDRPGAAPTG